MNGAEKRASVIGGAAGGIAGFLIARLRRSTRKGYFFYMLAGIGGGGLTGYGIARMARPAELRGMQAYPMKEERVILAGTYPSGDKGEKKVKWGQCALPDLPKHSNLDQWVVLQRRTPSRNRPTVSHSLAAYEALKSMSRLPTEEMVVMLLDNHNKVIGTSTISRGSRNQTLVDASALAQVAVASNASRMIMAHNHPSGESTPSADDVALTRRISEVGKLLGVHLVDHLIIGRDGYTSLTDTGVIPC